MGLGADIRIGVDLRLWDVHFFLYFQVPYHKDQILINRKFETMLIRITLVFFYISNEVFLDSTFLFHEFSPHLENK